MPEIENHKPAAAPVAKARPTHIYLVMRERNSSSTKETVRRVPMEVVTWEGEIPVISRSDGNWEEYVGEWEAVTDATEAVIDAPVAKGTRD